jgi:hypothetical protein
VGALYYLGIYIIVSLAMTSSPVPYLALIPRWRSGTTNAARSPTVPPRRSWHLVAAGMKVLVDAGGDAAAWQRAA